MDQWNRIESPEITDPHKYSLLTFDKGTERNSIEKDGFLNKQCKTIRYLTCSRMNFNIYLAHCTKTNSKCTVDQNVKLYTQSRKNIGETLHDPELANKSLA
jgi:hypothetical protein